MAPPLLSQLGNMEIRVRLTVFNDAVKAEIDSAGRATCIGWFRDETSSLAAACERELMRSAIIPELRKLPKISVLTEYKNEKAGRPVRRFIRGTATKNGVRGRRVVLLPGATTKSWLF